MTAAIRAETSRCYRCGEEKPRSEFYADSRKACGRKSICKPCDLEKSKEYYAEHRVEKLERYAARHLLTAKNKRKD